MSKRVSPTERIRADIDALFASERDLAATLEDVARLSVRLMMQTGIEAEVDEFLGRGRYERRGDDDRPGSRNGHQHRRIPVEERPGGRLMAQQSTNTLLDQATADRLSVAFHHCFSDDEAADDLFADDVFYDLLPPMWRFQLEGPAETFTNQLRAIGEGPVEIEIVRTVPTATGFVTEHVEAQHTPACVMTARRIHLCEVHDGRITAVTTYCNGGWDAELRARHAADAPMLRP